MIDFRLKLAVFAMLLLCSFSMASWAKKSSSEAVFGPHKYHASFSGKTKTNSFNVKNPNLSPGRMVITNGSFPLPKLKKCAKSNKHNFIKVAKCKIKNKVVMLKALLSRPSSVEVEFNGVIVVKKSDWSDKIPKLILSVPLKAKNNLKVWVKGFPTQYISVEVDRTTVANQAPMADFTVTPGPATDPLNYKFDESLSKDPDGQIVNYSYDFGVIPN
ncbi:MAG: hypothetical protein KDD22_01575 [Bdellovibrionales bacterium]|nr:hypothetical protein [Bdellovibrionales bacterium]